MCREVAETYFWPGEHEFNKKRHVIITSALVFSALLGASDFSRPRFVNEWYPLTRRPDTANASCYAVSLITCDLGLILELAGGFSATALAYLFRELVWSEGVASARKGSN